MATMARCAAALPTLPARRRRRAARCPHDVAAGSLRRSRSLDAKAVSLDGLGRMEEQDGGRGDRHGGPGHPLALASALALPIAAVRKGLESRLEADEEFLFKLLWEVVQDQAIIVLTVVGSCGLPAFWTPEQLASACLLHATAFFNDILLVYFLAATTTEHVGEPGKRLAHMFQPSETATLGDRWACWLDKFCLYGPLGLGTALVSHVIMSAVFLKDPSMLSPAHVLKVGLVGLLHLGISSNTRYQVVNGADVLYYKVLDKGAARSATMASRLVNQVVGGRMFLWLSALIL
ncbi:hypothetical protein HOP50_02g11280 [Chloropicon primus]|uniref:Uncharacterized protein n=1 Tax=Chloropicon primus TaxID=1764295 RepID=A0A5B8MEN4_9CHLO|nr:hypothetical protein A3770_02p11420 [Chloropicon primus]UPQ97833.1 hypothetical protein HOP50_02g11280 [Chloropicon primus]|eukprot:QDZ18624.1 hypothetical protein A3770_02p11420 [Chloropicon primus]